MGNDLLDRTIKMLAELPDFDVQHVYREPSRNGHSWDAVILAEVKAQPVRFIVESRSSGYPRDMQYAINQISEVSNRELPVPDIPLVIAPAISESSRDLLRKNDVSYVDGGGSLYINLPQALYWIDRPVPSSEKRSLRDIYHGSSARVLHTLLVDADQPWHINELAERSGVSLSTAHKVCRYLEDQLWMEKIGKGPHTVRLLNKPGKLLDAWANAHSLSEYTARRFHKWTRSPHDLLRSVTDALEDSGIEYALTLSSGSQLVAPHVTDAGHAWVLVPSDAARRLDEVSRKANLRAVDDGESVSFLLTRESSSLLHRRQIHDMWIASDIQLYLDLWSWPQRGKEQAQHLRSERIEF